MIHLIIKYSEHTNILLTRNPLKQSTAGFLVVRLQGNWYPYCAKEWSDRYTNATCVYFGLIPKNASFETIQLTTGKGTETCSSVVFLKCT